MVDAMKILIITSVYPTPENQAPGIFIKEQVESLKKCGLEADILVVKGKLFALPKLWKRMRAKYDAIHAHYGTLGWLGRMQLKTPLVVSFLGDDVLGTPNKKGRTKLFSRLLVWSHKALAKIAAGVIVQSDEMKSVLGASHAKVIPYGIDLSFFKPENRIESCKALGLNPTGKYILFANNPEVPVKNFALAEEAFRIVKEKFPDAELITLASQAKGEAPVYQPRHKVPIYMNACDVLIITSFHEGSPMVIKEAMACNLPIVSVDAGDVRKVIGDTKNSFIMPRDPAKIAERIIDIFNSGERSNGRENIQDLEISKVAQRVIGVYKSVCQ
jgi:glycosyltransferase involved in cell wall biosynthesis